MRSTLDDNAEKLRRAWTRLPPFALLLMAVAVSGCASITNPVANGIPVRLVPPELLAGPVRGSMQTIPLTLLRQKPPKFYQLAPGDVLGVFIEGVLPATAPNQPPVNPPVYFPQQTDRLATGLQPSLGFPIAIEENGTVVLPMVEPIKVAGLSTAQATEAIRRTYLDEKILLPGRERLIITLMHPRRTRIVVMRQEVGGLVSTSIGNNIVNNVKRGVGEAIDLKAYENDVLHALAISGGLPGLDVYSDIYIFKQGDHDPALVASLENLQPGQDPKQVDGVAPRIIQIPTRLSPGQPLPFKPEDVILEAGDVVFLEARAAELFFTGGLLPSNQFELPRDYDLDVITAVAQAGGTLYNGAFGGSNLAGLIIQRGMGNPSPSLLTVLRRTPDGGQVPIRVDLDRAMRDSRERIFVRSGDVLILQETPGQAVARYISQTFTFNLDSNVIDTGSTLGTAGFRTENSR